MPDKPDWAAFFARQSERFPGGVIDTLVSDLARSPSPLLQPMDETRKASEPRPDPVGSEIPGRLANRDTPKRIARLLSDQIRRKPSRSDV